MPLGLNRIEETVIVLPLLVAAGGCGEQGASTSSRIPTYHEDVAPILAANCATCHRPGAIAPFSLLTYEDAAQVAGAIATSTAERTMPPFSMDNSGACNTFVEARWLDDAEIATLDAWAKAGAPAGDATNAPPAPVLEPAGLGRVDMTIDMGVSYHPNLQVEDDYRCFIIDPGLVEDRFITAFDVKPGEPREVHHLTLFALDSQEAEEAAATLDAAEPGPGYTCYGDIGVPDARWLVGWGPGETALFFPEGTGLRMKAGRKTVLQMHYNKQNGVFPDRSKIDLRLAEEVAHEARIKRIADTDLYLPPKQPAIDEIEEVTIPPNIDSVTLWGLWPHMHTMGTKLRVTANHLGEELCLAQVNQWNFHWQGFSHYTKPITLSGGDSIRIRCSYDTMSRDTVTGWGEGTFDEMCIAFFFMTQN
jgi:hypothetical protein